MCLNFFFHTLELKGLYVFFEMADQQISSKLGANKERLMQHLINDHEAFIESILYVSFFFLNFLMLLKEHKKY
jgi:hypothetical protein